jgi:APA family basic amino acid/polyamine antiporter
MINENEGLKREIGVWGLASNSINIIIGAGIFILPAIVAERLGNAGIWPYIICGILMILIMLCFAEIGTRITVTGGAYSYIEVAFGRYAGFLTTNIFIFGASVMANAAVANGLADTISYFIPFFKTQWIRILFFAMIFGGLAYYNVRGIRKAIMIVKFNTVIKLVPLLMIAIFGWFFIPRTGATIIPAHPLSDIGEMSLILLFAFVGAETALNVSGEIKDPLRTIPRGIMLSVFVVVILYMAIQLTVYGILGDSIVNFKDAPLAQAASIMLGSAGIIIVIIGASFSMFGNISGMVLNMPRVLYAAARDKVIIPESLAKIHPVFLTPHISIITYAAMGFIFASIGEFKQLAMLSSASYLIIYFGVVMAVIKFRMNNSAERKGTYNIRGGYSIPVIAALAIIWVLSNLAWVEIRGMMIFIALVTAVYFIPRIFNRVSK